MGWQGWLLIYLGVGALIFTMIWASLGGYDYNMPIERRIFWTLVFVVGWPIFLVLFVLASL